jgi:GT2 family glycosyltransferase
MTSLKKKPLSFPYLSGCCLLFRRSLVENEPLFDEDFFMYGEDVYLSWRIQKTGKAITCTDDVTIIHEGTGSSNHGDLFYEYHVARGHILLALKTCEHHYDLPLFMLGRILYLSTRALIRSLRYFNLTPFVALVLCWFPLKIRHNCK